MCKTVIQDSTAWAWPTLLDVHNSMYKTVCLIWNAYPSLVTAVQSWGVSAVSHTDMLRFAQLQQDWDRSAIHLSSAVQVMIKCAQCCVQSVMLSVDLLHESQSSKCKPSTNDRWAVYSTKSNCITSVVEYIAFPACLLSSDQNSPIFFLSTGLKETCSSTYLLYTVVSLLNSEIHIHLWKN